MRLDRAQSRRLAEAVEGLPFLVSESQLMHMMGITDIKRPAQLKLIDRLWDYAQKLRQDAGLPRLKRVRLAHRGPRFAYRPEVVHEFIETVEDYL